MSLLIFLAYPEIVAALLILAVCIYSEVKRFGKSSEWKADEL